MPKPKLGCCCRLNAQLLSAPKGDMWGESLLPLAGDKREEVTIHNSLKVFIRRVPQQWKLPDNFQVLSYLQDDLAQNINFCCFF